MEFTQPLRELRSRNIKNYAGVDDPKPLKRCSTIDDGFVDETVIRNTTAARRPRRAIKPSAKALEAAAALTNGALKEPSQARPRKVLQDKPAAKKPPAKKQSARKSAPRARATNTRTPKLHAPKNQITGQKLDDIFSSVKNYNIYPFTREEVMRDIIEGGFAVDKYPQLHFKLTFSPEDTEILDTLTGPNWDADFPEEPVLAEYDDEQSEEVIYEDTWCLLPPHGDFPRPEHGYTTGPESSSDIPTSDDSEWSNA